MRRKKKMTWEMKLVLFVFTLLMLLVRYRYVHITGADIRGIEEMGADSNVSIMTDNAREKVDEYIYELNEEGVLRLKDLILESEFKRFNEYSTILKEFDMYTIIIGGLENGYVMLNAYGNDFISVSAHAFDGYKLRIKNPNWKAELLKIMEECGEGRKANVVHE